MTNSCITWLLHSILTRNDMHMTSDICFTDNAKHNIVKWFLQFVFYDQVSTSMYNCFNNGKFQFSGWRFCMFCLKGLRQFCFGIIWRSCSVSLLSLGKTNQKIKKNLLHWRGWMGKILLNLNVWKKWNIWERTKWILIILLAWFRLPKKWFTTAETH